MILSKYYLKVAKKTELMLNPYSQGFFRERWCTILGRHMNLRILAFFCASAGLAGLASGQATAPANAAPGAPGQTPTAPPTLTLKDALAQAQLYAPQFLSAVSDVNTAHEDILQARAARRPQLSGRSEYLGTQGHGVLPTGRFVTNDGIHVYRDWA